MAQNTKLGYASALKRLSAYLTREGHAAAVDPATGRPKVPMDEALVMAFLGYSTTVPGKKDAQPSYSALNNYVSAIKNAHKEAHIKISDAFTTKLGNFLTGAL